MVLLIGSYELKYNFALYFFIFPPLTTPIFIQGQRKEKHNLTPWILHSLSISQCLSEIFFTASAAILYNFEQIPSTEPLAASVTWGWHCLFRWANLSWKMHFLKIKTPDVSCSKHHLLYNFKALLKCWVPHYLISWWSNLSLCEICVNRFLNSNFSTDCCYKPLCSFVHYSTVLEKQSLQMDHKKPVSQWICSGHILYSNCCPTQNRPQPVYDTTPDVYNSSLLFYIWIFHIY